MQTYLEIYRKFDSPYLDFDNIMLGPAFPEELDVASRLWFSCGYWPGIASYLNFFLLKDFIVTHDDACSPRFQTFRSMAESFYQTDLFIRDVTDTALKPTGGISSKTVRTLLKQMMRRHERISIPSWMMAYFGFSLLDMVEKYSGALTDKEKRLHLAYMSKAYRIMGIAFTEDRGALEVFSRHIEQACSGSSPHLKKHAKNILLLGEMANVSSDYGKLSVLLPEKTRDVFRGIYQDIRPNLIQRYGARILGRLLLKKAIGAPRKAVPVEI